jgi:hypothetical protein
MQTNEFWELVRKLEEGAQREQEPAASLLRGTRNSESSLATDVQRLAAVQPAISRSEAVSAPARSGESANSGDSTASTVLKTIGMVTGVGPLVTGLVKLFGSGGGASEPAALTPYSLPESVSVEAGVAGDRSFVPLSYSQSGSARPAGEQKAGSSSTAPQIHVNVQAMDSRSFLDHSDEIARAVREAMLRSHSINDVVSEL